MAQVAKHSVDNGTGAAVRAAINNVFAAAVSLNSGSGDSSITTKYAYMLFVDTSTSPVSLKMRNAANNAWITISSDVTATNLGLATAASPTITGTADFDSNTALKISDGTTAQRPGSPAVGMFRYNTTTNEFEGYSGSSPAWGSIGGSGGATGTGSDTVFLNYGQTVTGSYSIPANTNSLTAGPVSVASGQSVTIPTGSRWTIV